MVSDANGVKTNLLNSVGSRNGSVKITITPCQPKTLTHLPKRPPVDIAFSDLTYTVTEGRKKSKFFFFSNIFSVSLCITLADY